MENHVAVSVAEVDTNANANAMMMLKHACEDDSLTLLLPMIQHAYEELSVAVSSLSH